MSGFIDNPTSEDAENKPDIRGQYGMSTSWVNLIIILGIVYLFPAWYFLGTKNPLAFGVAGLLAVASVIGFMAICAHGDKRMSSSQAKQTFEGKKT